MKTVYLYVIGVWMLVAVFAAQAQAQDNEAGYNISQNCQASWTSSLDSLSGTPYLYHFKDNSTGNINLWTWDFGDGSSSSMQNPAHQYDSHGTYNVCLTVADINSPDSCYDQFCQEITTLQYFSLGGLVFAGDYPLNNPVPAGDTGIAYIYRVVGDQVTYVEEHLFHDYGYYGFGFLLPGKYLVKIGLTPGSTNYHSYFTTYSGNGVKWQNASHVTISDSNYYTAEIHLFPVRPSLSGTGIIRGYVKFEQGDANDLLSVSQMTVILYDNAQQPIRFTMPDSTGFFEFTSLPFDTYFLSADATGRPSATVTISITDNNPVAENINLTIFGSNVQGIPEGFQPGISVSPVYPNPVGDELCLRINSSVNSRLGIKISDLSGKVFQLTAMKILPGQNTVRIPVSHLPKGLYIIRIQPEAYYAPITGKFIK